MEIKEILESLDKIAKGDYYPEDLLYYENCKILLDYITNLQAIEEEHRKINGELREEIKKLKRQLDCKEKFTKIMPEGTEFIILSKADYDRQQEDIELGLIDCKSRIDKAIVLLKEAGCYDEETKQFCDDIWEELPELLNILQGDDNNDNR